MLAQLPNHQIDVEYLPASLHNRPHDIPDRVSELIAQRGASYGSISLGYADCGTGGLLDARIAGTNITRLPGAHCYEFFSGSIDFAAWHEAEPGTFFLTDFLVRQFEQLVIVGLGLDKHPELRDMYFGNYTRVLLITQSDDPELIALGQEAAARIGLRFEHRHVGLAPFTSAMVTITGPSAGKVV